jgi:hypothetical protein
MLKILDIEPIFFDQEPSITILDTSTSGLLIKKAADSRVEAFVSSLTPEEGKIYVHILAMGAGEFYGANRNADYFPEENLKNYHETFVTSPAHIFKHHINKDPNIAIGKVVFSIYNERMHRVEVIAWVDKQKGWDYVQRIERGEFPSTSMACHTPFDTCSICNNKAKSRQEYCVHLRTELGKVLPNGQKVMAINDGPLRFFDMSFVFKPADITSSVLQKVAYAKSGRDFQPALGSAENAELNGLVEKAAQIKKLSELIKEVEGQVVDSSSSLRDILRKVKDPDDEVLKTLVKFDLHHIISALSNLGISPSVSFFAKLIGEKITGESVDGIEHLVSGLLKEDAHSLHVPTMGMDKKASVEYEFMIKKAMLPYLSQSSLLPEHVMQRSSSAFPTTGEMGLVSTGNIGYSGNGPAPAMDPREAYLRLKTKEVTENSGLLKTLFMIGGAAVAAKWLLSKMIEAKMKEHLAENRNAPVKIVLVKSANEVNITVKLVKAAFLQDITKA